MMKPAFLISAILMSMMAGAGFPGDEGPGPASLPNIVFILADDMGYGDLGSYNPDSKIPTPHLDQLAAQGMRFTDAHASGPLCHPSRYGLLTGRFPFRTDTSRWREHALIEPGRMTIASLLRDGGYRTAMVGKWHLGFDENGYDQRLPGGPLDAGFDTFFGIRASTDIPPYFFINGDRALVPPTEFIDGNNTDGWTSIQGAFWREGGIAPNLQLENVLPRFTDEAVGVIRDHSRLRPDQPLFLYLAFPAPHTPWLPAESFQGISGASIYGDFMAMVDHMAGRVLQALEDSALADDTLVIFSSDNGPVWYDEDTGRFGHDSSGGLAGMKGDAYEGGHRMPFIVRWPGMVEPGSVSGLTIAFTDVLATFADIIDRDLPDGQGPDSFSFLPELNRSTDPDAMTRGPFVLKAGKGLMTVRSGKWKYIDGPGGGGFSDRNQARTRRTPNTPESTGPQLFDLGQDPGETINVIAENRAVAERLDKELRKVLAGQHTRDY
jgi:arylsulfatase A-like enzyme